MCCAGYCISTCNTGTLEMNRMKTPGYLYGAIAVLCVLTFVVGMVNATAATPFASNCTSGNGFGPGYHPSPDMIITHLEQSGVNVTEVKTAIANGNPEAVTTWLKNYRAANSPATMNVPIRHAKDLTNTTRQQQFLSSLEQQEVDVTGLKTALQNGNINAAKTWLGTYMQSHKPEMPGARMKRGHTTVQTPVNVRENMEDPLCHSIM